MFDVFYSGTKPNLFAHERAVDTIEQAQQQSRTRFFWFVNYLSDYTGFDFLWEPVPWQAHQRHAWASQHQSDSGTYLVPTAGYTDTNYHTKVILQKTNTEPWTIPTNIDVSEFDFSWHPLPGEQYEHHFPTQHQPMGGPVYNLGIGPIKLETCQAAKALPSKNHWKTYEAIDQESWDWSWHPDPVEPPYIYVFGNQWNFPEYKASVEYVVPGATERKYMDLKTTRLSQPQLFAHNLAVSKFDYSWEPNPFDPPYVYVFGNQWNPAVLEPTIIYTVPGATERKYVDDIVATVASSPADFDVLHDVADFDYSWRPNPTDPDYIYVFGNKWHTAEIMPTVEYCVGNATERKYMDYPRARLPVRQDNQWHTIQQCDWDYSWIPDPGDPPYIYVFGNQWHSAEIMPTVTYTVPGATERKYMDYPRAQLLATHLHWDNISHHDYEFDWSWCPDPGEPPMIYVFGNQHWPAEKMPMLRYCSEPQDEGLSVKYMDYPRATLLPNKAMWVVPEGAREEQMDFTWVPDPGEPPYIYQFATQWQKTGGPQYHVPGATETKYLEHVEIKIETVTVPIIEIDHLDGNSGQVPGVIKKVRYFDNYRDTLIRLAKSLVGEHEFVWVCSSICDYTDFDFSWHPEKWQSTMLHVFASNEQKFGDTFYMHVPTFAARAEKKALLEWYSVNYVPKIRVARRPMPVICHTEDSHVDAVKNTTWSGPLATFTTTDYVPGTMVTVPLWRTETKTIVPLSKGATSVVVPRVAVGDIRTQLYDYPYINKTQRFLKEPPLDIVFISNGEKYAGFHEQQLYQAVQRHGLDCNRIHHSAGVNGRVAAYQAAARLSTTPWFFAVFAKLEVDPKFDWSWQPDRMQQPKHYIFHAYNPVNGLTYGHQAMIAYNKRMVLENAGAGLDFTLDQPHEVVPLLSGVANYNETPWMAWRTAFREVLKLKHSLPDVESDYRLRQWLEVDTTEQQWSMKGAEDAVEYYDSVAGDFAALKRSYEWAWLASYAFMRRNLLPDR
jgi:hypothetical protein